MSRAVLFVCYYVLLLVNTSSSDRILGVFTIPSLSHQNSYRPLMETLSDRGHQVVVVTTHPTDYKTNEHPTLTQISVKDIAQPIWAEFLHHGSVLQERFSTIKMMLKYKEIYTKLMNEILSSQQIRNLIDNPEERFDLCFIAALTPTMFAFKDRFNCSLILVASQAIWTTTLKSFGNPTNPVAYPSLMTPYLENKTFSQRLIACLIDWFMTAGQIILSDQNDDIVRKYFGDGIRPVLEIQNNADMLFVNEGMMLDGIRPLVPNTLYLFGMHIKPNKPLPKDLKKILDNAKIGVIYLSLGSNVKSVHLSQVRIKAFLDAFKELPYTVLWKWENDTLEGKPDNVHISKWYPQQDIFAHPNVKCFITQGGQQSMEEAIHHNVPLIGMPFMGDQDLNVKKMIKFGIGTEMNLLTLNKQMILDAVNKIMKNPSYRQNIEKLSDLLKDQPQTSMERAVWWTEYVLRHKGAQHLRSPATNMPFYQYFMLDIIAFLSICLVAVVIVNILLCRMICGYFLRKREIKYKKS